jgi:hypothetical protein
LKDSPNRFSKLTITFLVDVETIELCSLSLCESPYLAAHSAFHAVSTHYNVASVVRAVSAKNDGPCRILLNLLHMLARQDAVFAADVVGEDLKHATTLDKGNGIRLSLPLGQID